MNRKKIIKISSPLLLVALIGGLSFNLANPSAETNKKENTFNYVQHEQKEQQRLLDFKNKTMRELAEKKAQQRSKEQKLISEIKNDLSNQDIVNNKDSLNKVLDKINSIKELTTEQKSLKDNWNKTKTDYDNAEKARIEAEARQAEEARIEAEAKSAQVSNDNQQTQSAQTSAPAPQTVYSNKSIITADGTSVHINYTTSPVDQSVQGIIDANPYGNAVSWLGNYDFNSGRAVYLLGHNPGVMSPVANQFANGNMTLTLIDMNGIQKTLSFSLVPRDDSPYGEYSSYLQDILAYPENYPGKVLIQFCYSGISYVYESY